MDQLINFAYRNEVNEVIALRMKVVLSWGVVLFLVFSILDKIVYPDLAGQFMNLRIFAAVSLMALVLASYFPWCKRRVTWLVYLSCLCSAGPIAGMVFLADGSVSRYYGGLNLVLLAMFLMNSYYVGMSILVGVTVVALYVIAAWLNPGNLIMKHFVEALYFICSTACFTVIMTKVFHGQNLTAFLMRQELDHKGRQLARLYKHADVLARKDALTKVYNRMSIMEFLRGRIKAASQAQETFCLIIFDIDHFKQINDTYGHIAGDKVIQAVALTVKKNIRQGDFIGRYGGDEFIMVLSISDESLIRRKLQILQEALQYIENDLIDGPIQIGLSFGVVRFNPDLKVDVSQLITLADNVLLEVKRSHRGGIRFA